MTYPDTGLGCLGVAIPHACDAIRLLVEEDDVGDFPQLGTLFPDVLFDVEYCGRVLLTCRL